MTTQSPTHAGESAGAATTAPRCPVDHGNHQAADPVTDRLRPIDELPGSSPMPVFGWRGNLLKYFRNPVRYMAELRRQHGDVARLAACRHQNLILRAPENLSSTVFAFGPEMNREFLSRQDDFIAGEARTPDTCEWVNSGMFSASGEEHAKHRALHAPAFKRSQMEVYYQDIKDLTGRMFERWQGRDEVDLVSEMVQLAADIASKCFYGQDPESRHQTLAAIMREFGSDLFSPVTSIPIDLPGTPYRRVARLAEEIRQMLAVEVERKMASENRDEDILALMLRAQESEDYQLTADQLASNVTGLFFAGHDVPAYGLVYTLLLLSQFPEAMSDLLDELDAEVDGDFPTYAQIWSLPVLDRVFRESLRLITPAILVFRQTAHDTHLAGYELPRGTEVLISPFMTHRDPDIWERPKVYDPRRWESLKPSNYEYMPFSRGKRQCVGAAFAAIEIKTVLCAIVQRFRIRPKSDSRFDFKFTFAVAPKQALPVRLGPQDRNFNASRVGWKGQIADLVDFA